MDPLAKARARLKALCDELNGPKGLTTKDVLTVDDIAAINAKVKEIEGVESEITALESAEAVRARSAVPVGADAGTADAGLERGVERNALGAPAIVRKDIDVAPEHVLSTVAASQVKELAFKGHIGQAQILREAGFITLAKNIELQEKAFDAQIRAVTAGSSTSAGALIPTPLSAQIIPLLRPEVTFLQGDPVRVNFVNGQYNQPRQTGTSTAGYVGEGVKKPVGEPTFDKINMTPRKLAGIVLITEEAKMWPLVDIERKVRDDLKRVMAQTWDLAAYFGSGAGQVPLGILNIVGITTIVGGADGGAYFVDSKKPTVPEIDFVMGQLELQLTLNNIPQASSWRWVMDYRTINYLKRLRIGDENSGVFAYPEMRGPNPTFDGIPVLKSTQFPINGGVGTNEGVIALIDFAHVLYAEEMGLTIKTAEQATVDVNGTLVHLWQQNMIGILNEMMHNWTIDQLKAVAKLTQVRWGAA